MFRFKKSIDVPYEKQGLIYFTSRAFEELGEEEQRKILNLCAEAGGEHHRAVFDFVTTDKGATAVCLRHAISRSTLERAVKEYYLAW